MAALALAAAALANPITVVIDTQGLATLSPPLSSLTLYFQFTGNAGESVAIDNFATDGALDANAIATNGSVTGSLPSEVTLSGSAGSIPSEYFEGMAIGNSISFSFDVTSLDSGVGPLFAMSLVDPLTALPPLDDNSQPIFGSPDNGMLVVFDASGEPMLSLYSNDLVGVLPGSVSSVPEPGTLALLSIALGALCAGRRHSRLLLA